MSKSRNIIPTKNRLLEEVLKTPSKLYSQTEHLSELGPFAFNKKINVKHFTKSYFWKPLILQIHHNQRLFDMLQIVTNTSNANSILEDF